MIVQKRNDKVSCKPNPLLDSRLISATFIKQYDIKLIDCGEYIQLYLYDTKKVMRAKDNDDELNLKKLKIEKMTEQFIVNNINEKTSLADTIEQKNIIRSKLSCQRLAKANMKSWRTFITLTFAENITNVKKANKRFKYFVDKVRRIKKDFKYLCITEFQKRGAIHYHILCNIDINDKSLFYEQEDNSIFKHIKYWNDGFTSVEPIADDCKKVIGYIAKYMTKDIDNRLFSHRRYFYSQNLYLPKANYIDLDSEICKEFYKKRIQDKELIYQNEYINPYDNTQVTFLEFYKKDST